MRHCHNRLIICIYFFLSEQWHLFCRLVNVRISQIRSSKFARRTWPLCWYLKKNEPNGNNQWRVDEIMRNKSASSLFRVWNMSKDNLFRRPKDIYFHILSIGHYSSKILTKYNGPIFCTESKINKGLVLQLWSVSS